jgi:hypothetical protein
MVRKIADRERRARLAVRHHLAPGKRSDDLAVVAADQVGLHASDPTSVFLAARARMREVGIDDIERVLYEKRSVIRILGMRRTMFTVPIELASVVHSSCTKALVVTERRRTIQLIQDAGIPEDADKWLRRAERETLDALASVGPATGAQLAKVVPAFREKYFVGAGTKWEGWQGFSTRILFLLAAQGHIVRGRPRGSWLSSQYEWAPMESWVPGGLEDVPVKEARAELVRRWLATYGPGATKDIKWWTGWTMANVREALADLKAVEVDLDGDTGFVLPGDLDPVRSPKPWAALLPSLDPTVMGWSQREWYLGPHRPALFDTNGNAGPTVWWNGRVVGGWGQTRGGEVAVRLLEDVGKDAADAIDAEADTLNRWLGGVRVTPRFRTPLEQQLAEEG